MAVKKHYSEGNISLDLSDTRGGKITGKSDVNIINKEGKVLFVMYIASDSNSGKIYKNEYGKRAIFIRTELDDDVCTIKHSSQDDIKSAIRVAREYATDNDCDLIVQYPKDIEGDLISNYVLDSHNLRKPLFFSELEKIAELDQKITFSPMKNIKNCDSYYDSSYANIPDNLKADFFLHIAWRLNVFNKDKESSYDFSNITLKGADKEYFTLSRWRPWIYLNLDKGEVINQNSVLKFPEIDSKHKLLFHFSQTERGIYNFSLENDKYMDDFFDNHENVFIETAYSEIDSAQELIVLLNKIKEDKYGRNDFEDLKFQIKYKTFGKEPINFIENEKITNTIARLYYKKSHPLNAHKMSPKLTEEHLEIMEKAEDEVKNKRQNKLEM